MTAPDITADLDEEIGAPCSHQLYPALGLQPPEWCSDDAVPGTDRCERHLYDDEESDR